MTGNNWFDRHINWTWVLAIVLGVLLVSLFEEIARPNYYQDTLSPKEYVSVPFFIAWSLCFSIRYLRRKSQSLWFLLVLVLPVYGVWMFLRLPNNNLLEDSMSPQGDELSEVS